MRSFARIFPVAALIALTGTQASAADLKGGPESSISDVTGGGSAWIVTIGGYGADEPSFLGSKRHDFGFVPIIDIRRAGEPESLILPFDAASVALYKSGRFRFGLAGSIEDSRSRDDDNRALHGLHDIDYTVELGVFAEYWLAPNIRTRVEVLQGVNGAEGLVGNLSADYVYAPNSRWQFTAGPRLEFGNTQFMNEYFGIRSSEVAASGLPSFHASGGLESVGVLGTARYNVTDRFSIRAFAEYQKLTDDAADSPLVVLRGSEDQYRFGIGAAYAFGIGGGPAPYK